MSTKADDLDLNCKSFHVDCNNDDERVPHISESLSGNNIAATETVTGATNFRVMVEDRPRDSREMNELVMSVREWDAHAFVGNLSHVEVGGRLLIEGLEREESVDIENLRETDMGSADIGNHAKEHSLCIYNGIDRFQVGDDLKLLMEGTNTLVRETSGVNMEEGDFAVTDRGLISNSKEDLSVGTFSTEIHGGRYEEGGRRDEKEEQSHEVANREKEFFVSDLVWGKVRSHPWWPGQIVDPSAASEKAMKYFKKDCLLVAYFGDQTFAWNEPLQLKPFRPYFLQMEIQSSLEAFSHAINCALDEVSRRVEYGLSCSCISEEAYAKIKTQIIVNAGIKEEFSKRGGGDEFLSVCSFEPLNLVEFIKEAAECPYGEVHRLELVIAQAQLLAFSRYKGYSHLPQFQMLGKILENDADVLALGEEMLFESNEFIDDDDEHYTFGEGKWQGEKRISRKNEQKRGGNRYFSKKERSLLDLYLPSGENQSELEDGKRLETRGFLSSREVDGLSEKDTIKSENEGKSKRGRPRKIWTEIASHLPSFQVDGTSGRDAIKNGKSKRGRKRKIQTDFSSQLLTFESDGWSGRDPTNSKSRAPKRGRKRKIHAQLSPFEVDGMSERDALKSESNKKSRRGRKKKIQSPLSSFEAERDATKSVSNGKIKGGEKPKNWTEFSKPDESFSQLCLAAIDPLKRYGFLSSIVCFFSEFRNSICLDRPSSDTYTKSMDKVSITETAENLSVLNPENIETSGYEGMKDSYWTDRIIQSIPDDQNETLELQPENRPEAPIKLETVIVSNPDLEELSPTALILKFTNLDAVPSVSNLNEIFRRYGPLNESYTEVLTKSSRAKVVFKRRCDAETAFSSAGKFSIFGPSLVSYRLKYLPFTPLKHSSTPKRQRRKRSMHHTDMHLIATK